MELLRRGREDGGELGEMRQLSDDELLAWGSSLRELQDPAPTRRRRTRPLRAEPLRAEPA